MGRGRPDSTGDAIYNGALDNAGGVAGLLELAAERAPNRRDPQVGTRFHQPSDEWEEGLDFAAAARDMRLYHRIGLRLANARDWPGWRPGAEFAALRARSDAARR